jgi:peptidyl-prolyl cis-trans isomerase C
MARLTEYVSFSIVWQVLYRLIVVPLLVLHLLISGAVAAESVPASVAASVAATVNGTIITEQDFKREFERIQRQKGISSDTTDETTQANLKREALENLISREILYQESVKQNITIDPAVVEREVDQAKGRFATPGQFAENMRLINMTEATVREQVRRGLAMRTLIEHQVGKNDAATDDELKAYYEQHREKFTSPFAEVREKVRNLVRQEKNITMLQRYAKSLRDVAAVVILLSGE